MKVKPRIILSIAVSILVIMLGVAIGSVNIPVRTISKVIWNNLIFKGTALDIEGNLISIIWNIRFPRVLLAFLVGGALAVSGVIMQSVLKNPLASSYTLGVSSGASLGAGLIMVSGLSLPLLGRLTLPFLGLVGGLGTVYLAIGFAAKIDKNMENNTIILVGMIFSLFINAILTLMIAYYGDSAKRLIFWQMGSFSAKAWSDVAILSPIIIAGVLLLLKYSRELDIMTFGEEQAMAMGVDIKRVKWILLGLSAALTGSAISFVGIIGFIDLIVPHVVRKLFGSSHIVVIPISFFLGGSFMIICDLIARIIIPMSELPVGAITAIIGAPFFAYVFFSRRRVI